MGLSLPRRSPLSQDWDGQSANDATGSAGHLLITEQLPRFLTAAVAPALELRLPKLLVGYQDWADYPTRVKSLISLASHVFDHHPGLLIETALHLLNVRASSTTSPPLLSHDHVGSSVYRLNYRVDLLCREKSTTTTSTPQQR